MTNNAESAGSDPEKKASQSGGNPLPKRFYKSVLLEEDDGRFLVKLDSRSIRTPGKKVVSLPSKEIAEMIAAEFDAQIEVIDPATMPATRLANTVIDGVLDDPQPLIEDVLRFAGSDLVCYRADHPAALVELQNQAWDPVVDWALASIGARMVLAEGVMHVEQNPESIAALGSFVRRYRDPFVIAGLHVMTTITGSALLALGVSERAWTAEEAWSAAHVDEDWNISQWGEDGEAMRLREKRRIELMIAARFVQDSA